MLTLIAYPSHFREQVGMSIHELEQFDQRGRRAGFVPFIPGECHLAYAENFCQLGLRKFQALADTGRIQFKVHH